MSRPLDTMKAYRLAVKVEDISDQLHRLDRAIRMQFHRYSDTDAGGLYDTALLHLDTALEGVLDLMMALEGAYKAIDVGVTYDA